MHYHGSLKSYAILIAVLRAALVVVGCTTALWHSFLTDYILSIRDRSPASLVIAMIDGINGDCLGSNYGCGLGKLDLVFYCYCGRGWTLSELG